jgi:hypothetical protein
MTADEYIARRLDEQYDWLSKKSSANQRWYRRLRAAEICLASSVPILAAYANRSSGAQLAAALAGALTAIVAGTSGLWKHQDLWIQYRAAAEALQREKMLYLTRTEPYDDPESAFTTLVHRVESILGTDNARWSQALRRQQSEQDPDSATWGIHRVAAHPTDVESYSARRDEE